MKKFKRFATAFCAVCLVVAMTALVGCNLIEDMVNTIEADTTAGKFVSSVEWREAISAAAFDNVTAQIKENGATAMVDLTLMRNGDRYKLVDKTANNSVKYAASTPSGTNFYDEQGNQIESMPIDLAVMYFGDIARANYDDFTYDLNAHAFVVSDEVQTSDESIVKIVFDGKKITRVERKNGDYATYSDYGTTTFTFPEIAESELTTEQWNAATSRKTFDNVTVTVNTLSADVNMFLGGLDAVMKADGNLMKNHNNKDGTVHFAVVADGKTRMYTAAGVFVEEQRYDAVDGFVYSWVNGLAGYVFNYDAAQKAYVRTATTDASGKTDGSPVKVSVAGGKITRIDYANGWWVEYSDYGTTSISIPKAGDELANDLEFALATLEESFLNVTCAAKTVDNTGAGFALDYVLQRDGGKGKNTNNENGNVAYAYYDGTNSYSVASDGTRTFESDYDGMALLIYVYVANIDSVNFSYDSVKKAYVPSGVDEKENRTLYFENGKIVKVEFTDGSVVNYSNYGTTVVNLPA